ncbi:hypothetical protein CHLNCDRAFT_144713 [Chlorella variabilis]|uniref:PARP-type domain-containing protein n=1 Tax=Chlorella variabilis TaxID=554065 RepID=E1ZCV4_CHLVA|nr:hypothetical protein CHLNCDRAFT_144713 [Chlorella variabilis]EFN56113.1 hypothetical protein CHLNCDRAFT_144713 [Chlorella variabilis]|eukprot:XP_005848215.1 hypothetical protein CHLNCDRAFT_144713 [Chlorella variabilis]
MAEWRPQGGATNAYMLEYARSSRSKCQGCKALIGKGDLRLGSPLQMHDAITFKWRHWGCTTPAVLFNMRGKVERHGQALAIAGLGKLKAEDRPVVQQSLDSGVLTPAKKNPHRKAAKKRGAWVAEEEDEDEDYVPRPEDHLSIPRRQATKRSKK